MKNHLLALLLFGSPLIAQEGPSFDCTKAGGAAEELVCSDSALARIDRRLAEVYGRAVRAARGLDAGAAEAEAALKSMQRGWIKGRDECWKADDLRACVEEAYLRREGALVAMWMLDAPYTEATWACGGTPANEVYVAYFDTELPSIRLEYGDGVEAMQLSRTGSGLRYDGAFGRFFWEKGGEAMFVWEEGVEQSCILVAG